MSFCALLALAVCASAMGPSAPLSSSTISDPHALVGQVLPYSPAYRPLRVFPEDLVFRVSWGIFEVGQATLEVKELVEFNGRPAYHVVSRAVSNSWCDTFYKVDDLNESWIDALTLQSLGYSKKLREGRFFRDEWVLYDAATQTFLSKRTSRDGNFSYFAGTTTASVQDVLSSLYFVRAQETLEPGQVVTLDVNTRENWPLAVRVVKEDHVKTPAGLFDTVLVEPSLRQEGLFIQKGKRLEIWLAKGPNLTPVLMRVEVFFGHITAKLSKML